MVHLFRSVCWNGCSWDSNLLVYRACYSVNKRMTYGVVTSPMIWSNSAELGAIWNERFTAPLPHAYTPAQRIMTYDADNRLATFNGQGVTHDLDGNMTYGPLTNNTLVSYTYDARNRLVQVGPGGPSGLVGYTYDPSGNRIALTNNGQVTRFVINPNARLSQVLIRIRGGITNYYVYGLGLVYEVTETATNSYLRYYHYDYRGLTVALTDHESRVTDRYEYSAYGTLTYRIGTTDMPFLYNGRFGVQTDPNGLLYMRARYYNPYICRFLNPDPAGFSGGLNFYAYADGNPVNYLDPFGLCAESGGFFSWLGQAATGFAEGAWDTVSGLASAVWHIDQTAAGLWNAATHPLQTLDALSLALAEYADVAFGGDPRAIGRGVFELAAMALPVTKVKYAGTVGELTRTVNVADELALAARRAAVAVGPGHGPVYGTKVHVAFANEVRALGNPNVRAEVSFLNGRIVEYGTPGSVRVDAVWFAPNNEVFTVFDLKTGSATLTPQRILQIQQQVGNPVPVIPLRP